MFVLNLSSPVASFHTRVRGRVDASACFLSSSALAISAAVGGCLGGLPGFRFGVAPDDGLGGG